MNNRLCSLKTHSARPIPENERNMKNEGVLTTKSGSQKRLPKMESSTISFNFLFVENFDAHFGSQKTATKLVVAKQPTFSKFVTVFNVFLPTSNAAHAANHTTFRSQTTPHLFKARKLALAPWRPHLAAPETKDFLTTKIRVVNNTLFPSTHFHWLGKG